MGYFNFDIEILDEVILNTQSVMIHHRIWVKILLLGVRTLAVRNFCQQRKKLYNLAMDWLQKLLIEYEIATLYTFKIC